MHMRTRTHTGERQTGRKEQNKRKAKLKINEKIAGYKII